MAIWKRKKNAAEAEAEAGERGKEIDYSPERVLPYKDDENARLDAAGTTELQRGLKARHITMIAIGGAIGTGEEETISYSFS